MDSKVAQRISGVAREDRIRNDKNSLGMVLIMNKSKGKNNEEK